MPVILPPSFSLRRGSAVNIIYLNFGKLCIWDLVFLYFYYSVIKLKYDFFLQIFFLLCEGENRIG